jgi:hypothetical protein
MANETYIYGKRALATWQKRPIYMAKETQSHGKETYIYGKRDLYIWQKRPIYMAKETQSHGKETYCTPTCKTTGSRYDDVT